MVGAIILAVGVGAVLAVLPMLTAAEAESSASPTPVPSSTPVISATPIPEPPPRDPWAGDESVEHEMEIGAREGPRGTAIDTVRTMFPDDYAYGYITDEGFGMSFKADAPPEALAILDAVGDPYELHENVGFTELDIEPQIPRVVELVQKAVGDQAFVTGANVSTVTVEVEIYPDSGTKTDHAVLEGAALEQLIDDIRPELYPGFDIRITSVPGAGIGW